MFFLQGRPASRAAASSMVSGKTRPLVSGRRKDRQPTTTAPPPMIRKGKGAYTESRLAMAGAHKAPIRATVEQIPTAEFLIGVGNISAV